jgi:hypothetical protein
VDLDAIALTLDVRVVTTPELMQRWGEKSRIPRAKLIGMLRRIERAARFVPAADVPGYEWWSKLAGDEPV